MYLGHIGGTYPPPPFGVQAAMLCRVYDPPQPPGASPPYPPTPESPAAITYEIMGLARSVAELRGCMLLGAWRISVNTSYLANSNRLMFAD
jgi:hypothetical protein